MAGSVYEGKTFDEAVRKGLEALRLTRAEAVITTIEEGKGGFLGIGSRPFKVSVARRPGGAIREPLERETPRGGRRGGREEQASGGRGAPPARGGGRGNDRGPQRGGRDEQRAPREEQRPARGGGERPPRGGRDAQPAREAPAPREARRPAPPPPAPSPVPPAVAEDEGDDSPRKRRRRGRRGGRGRRRGGPGGAEGDHAPAPAMNGPRAEAHLTPRSEPAAASPVSEPPRMEPGRVEPMRVEPVRMEPVRVEPARVEPVRVEPVRVEPARVEPAAAAFTPAPTPTPMEEYAPSPVAREVEAPREEFAPRPARPPRMERAPREERSASASSAELSDTELQATSRKLTEELLRAMGFDPKVQVKVDGDRVDVSVELERDGDLLNGRQGETRQALQHLLNRFLNKGDGSRYHLQLEVNDYWQRREVELEALAKQMADDAVTRNAEVVTGYLNSQERRMIHVTLKEDARVRTFSLGDGMLKRVAVAPADFPERTEDDNAS